MLKKYFVVRQIYFLSRFTSTKTTGGEILRPQTSCNNTLAIGAIAINAELQPFMLEGTPSGRESYPPVRGGGWVSTCGLGDFLGMNTGHASLRGRSSAPDHTRNMDITGLTQPMPQMRTYRS